MREKRDELEANNNGPFDDADTLNDMEAAARRAPALVSALQREGMPLREYAKFWMAFWPAAFAHGMKKEGDGSKEMYDVVNPANVKFFEQNEKQS